MANWPEDAIETACDRAAKWYRNLVRFPARVNLGKCVGRKFPAVLSEQDCVMHFARFLNEAEIKWEDIHHQVSCSRWLFELPHEAGVSDRWCADLALVKQEDLLRAQLPAKPKGFQFDACLEFAYLSDFYLLPRAATYGEPEKGRQKVEEDAKQIGRYLRDGVCRIGYVIVFQENDSRFNPSFAADKEREHGCRVRFVTGT